MRPLFLAFQAVPPAQRGSVAPATEVPAEVPAPEGSSSFLMMLMFVPLLLFLFWQSRSQQKKQSKAVADLKKGDRVLTQSGLVGRLVELDARYAKMELAPGVKVQVLRSSVSGRDEEAGASAPKSKSEDEKKN